MALRMPEGTSLVVDGVDVVAEVHTVLRKMVAFARQVRDGSWRGYTGERVRTVVNIGIGGSDLGPAMAYDALRAYADGSVECRFVSNVDGADLLSAVEGLDAAQTLFIVSSKTFTTLETITNATSARQLAGRPARRRCRGGAALRGGVNERREGHGVRHRHREHVRVLGLGRRALLDVVGHRVVADARDRARALPRLPCGRARDGRALPHRAARREPARDDGAASAAGTATTSARRPTRSCRTRRP
jgi:hypothetical protein